MLPNTLPNRSVIYLVTMLGCTLNGSVSAEFRVELRGQCAESITFRMRTCPKSPKEMTKDMLYFPRMLDKIRLHLRGELHEDYQENFGAPKAADSVCCNFLRVKHSDLIQRVKQGGTDEEILEWCFETGRRLNEGDLFVWNGFASKLGWRDSVAPRLEQRKQEMGIAGRDDIQCIPDLIDFDEGRLSEASKTP